MRLYLIQHGDAVEKALDPERPLTEHGRRDVERVAAFVDAAGIRVPVIWHSGKTRARQTAELLAKAMGATLHEHIGLNPKDRAVETLHAIEEGENDIAIVGHLPHLSSLAELLLRTKSGSEPVRFQRGGILALGCDDDGAWRIGWMIVPELLRD